MADLRVHGTVGKATVRIMTDAILRSPAASGHPVLDPATLVLLDAGEPALTALSSASGTTPVVANGDAVPATRLPACAITFGLGERSTLWADDLEDRKSTRLNSSHVRISYA